MMHRQITLMGRWRGEVRKWRLRQRVCLVAVALVWGKVGCSDNFGVLTYLLDCG